MSSQAEARPVPVPDEASAPFFEGALAGRLMLQRCVDCGSWMWPVAWRCRSCLGPALSWEASAGRGTLYSFVLVHQSFHPGFASDLPYNVAVVDLDEGLRVTANVVGVANDALRIGMPLVVTFERVSETVALPRFVPVGQEP